VLILSFVMILTGVYKNGEGPSGLLTLPEAAWELSLGIYCAWKGFRSSSPLAKPEMAMADPGGQQLEPVLDGAPHAVSDIPGQYQSPPAQRDPRPPNRLRTPNG
jgi:hypothetical protein